jgi:predicted Fe-Mo cluster-binding NifX family protein
MPAIKLEIKYSTNELPGKCVQCLAEQELNVCLRGLLMEEQPDLELEEKYEMLVAFLQSPELVRMRAESEKHLLEGKRVFLKISTANGVPKYELEVSWQLEVTSMKIAAISDDGVTVSQHFGRAPLYVVVTVEGDKVTAKETRPKAGHHTFAGGDHPETAPGERHGYDAGAQSRHAAMAQSIDDCQVLIAGGMGWGAYDSLKSRGIEAVVTDVENIEEAVKLYVEGKLPNLMERLH